jgi:hypothetical protein
MVNSLKANVPDDWREQFLTLLSSQGVGQTSFAREPMPILRDVLMILAWCFSVMLYVIPIIFLLPRFDRLPFSRETNDLIGGLTLIVGSILLFVFIAAPRAAFYARRLGDDFWIGRDASRAIKAAKRAPVLYLRSFMLDQMSSRPPKWQFLVNLLGGWPLPTGETWLVANIVRYAPVLAVGRPHERDPPPGALRIYLTDDQWEVKVQSIIPLCQLVIWASGFSEGLQWEIERLVKIVPPGRLLVWFHVGIEDQSAKDQWARFVDAYKDVFPKPLPRDLGRMRYMAFDNEWHPIPLPAGDEPALSALHSFVKSRLA